MALDTPLYHYNGRSFGNNFDADLSFCQKYFQAISEFADLSFLKVYSQSGSVIEKTFTQFGQDVEAVRRQLESEKESEKESVLVTIDGNTYAHCVFLVAGLLSDYIICPLNPNESKNRITDKINQIEAPCKVYVGLSWSIRNPNSTWKSMELQEHISVGKHNLPNKKEDFERPFVYIFTSGTTGYSKIVQLPERAVLSNISSLIKSHELLTRKAVFATAMPIFHVNTLIFSFMCNLLSGQQLILFESYDIFNIIESLVEDRVQIFSANPSILQTFVDFADRIHRRKIYLEYCVSAASSLSPELATKFVTAFPFKLIQGYGLSEATNFSLLMPTALTKTRTDYWLTHFSRPSVGVELEGNSVVVLSEILTELNCDLEGEICIRGHNVMLGYKNTNNNAVFASGYLHTGDLGFYKICAETQRKFFFITGRSKDVIKRFGHTVSLVEIDDYLAKWLPRGVQAIAVPFLNSFSGEELGVIVSDSATDENLEGLKLFLVENIPAWMRPRVILQSLELLRTESGKPRRWALANLFKEYNSKSFSEIPLVIK